MYLYVVSSVSLNGKEIKMATVKDMLQKLTNQFLKTQRPMPVGQERMKKVQEAARKVSEEVKRGR